MKVTLSYDEENKRSLLTYNLVITCEWQSIVLTQTPSLTKNKYLDEFHFRWLKHNISDIGMTHGIRILLALC